MNENREVLENLRLLKAFFRIRDPVVRREIIELVETRATSKSEKETTETSE